MEKNTIIGFLLLVGLFVGYQFISQPSQADVQRYQAYIDSLRQDSIQNYQLDSLKKVSQASAIAKIEQDSSLSTAQKDSLRAAQSNKGLAEKYGDFAFAASGVEQTIILENEKLKVYFSNQGGRILKTEIKGFLGYNPTTEDRYDKTPSILGGNKQERFEYFIPMTSVKKGDVSTMDLYFEPILKDKSISFRAYTDSSKSRYFEQTYTLKDGYVVDYAVKMQGLSDLMPRGKGLQLNWLSILNKMEKNDSYERTMSSIHYKESEENPSYCTCASSVTNEAHQKPLKWISHSQQFFNTALIATGNTQFANAIFNTDMLANVAYDSTELKKLHSFISFPASELQTAEFTMQMYIGPNDYDILSATNTELESIIPFGWSFFGLLGEYVFRPMFNAIVYVIPSHGWSLILLTLIIRLLIYPLQYKMLLSGVKMQLLRPELDVMRKKYADNPQTMQMEQMKMFNQYGVSPLGGCLPMLATMPVWMALYRFFPASIEFRQQSFWWAADLSTYDSILEFNFYIPFYGDHVSLFTLLWAISMFAFLRYNSSQMDMNAGGNPGQMKMIMTMQYAFPVIFFFALNSWAAGLTAYMLLSNLLNIFQTWITKNYIINKEKVRAQMDENKKNPKVSRFQQQYEEMMKQQQARKPK